MTGRRRLFFLLALGASLAAITGCGTQADLQATTNVHGLSRDNLDTTCEPCEDFNRYANGGWAARNEIPAIYPFWGTSLEVYDRNNEIIRDILESAASSGAPHGTVAQKIGDFYFSALDSARIEKEGFDPIRADLDRIAAIGSVDDLVAVIDDYHGKGLSFLFGGGALQDLADSGKVILYVTSGGLGLPDRDYYTRDDAESVELREQYVEHVANMLGLLGDAASAARTRAERILALETRLAEVTLTAVENRNPANWYGVKTVAEADALMPDFPWGRYLDAIGLPELTSFSLAPDKFFAEMNDMLTEVPLDEWRHYLRWNIVSGAAPYLSTPFVNEGFRFNGQVLTGQEELSPRWKRAKGSVDGALGEALGQLYVERAFSPEAKAGALALVENLRTALREKIDEIDWMGPETKDKARIKLEAFKAKIGYPDKWKDYSSLDIVRGSWIENVRRAARFAQREDLAKIGQPPDLDEWVTNPQTVNAFYHPLMNDITFPAGILQPPCFDVEADDAVNYGCMGVVIGHEMTHGFDDKGRQFDAEGNMADWWTQEDGDRFGERAQRMVAQFDAYTVIDSLNVNGELTLGENIADRGGLRIAYRALQIAREGKADPMIDGFTQEQRFFLSYAQFFRVNYKPEFLKLIVNTDPHTPNMYRVNGPLSHMSEFAEAFGCRPGDWMYTAPAEQVHVW